MKDTCKQEKMRMMIEWKGKARQRRKFHGENLPQVEPKCVIQLQALSLAVSLEMIFSCKWELVQ